MYRAFGVAEMLLIEKKDSKNVVLSEEFPKLSYTAGKLRFRIHFW